MREKFSLTRSFAFILHHNSSIVPHIQHDEATKMRFLGVGFGSLYVPLLSSSFAALDSCFVSFIVQQRHKKVYGILTRVQDEKKTMHKLHSLCLQKRYNECLIWKVNKS